MIKDCWEVLVNILQGVIQKELYEGIYNSTKELGFHVLCLVARLLILLTFPISIPILTWIVRRADKQYLVAQQKAREEIWEHYSGDRKLGEEI